MGNVWAKRAADASAVILCTNAQCACSLDCPEQLDTGLAKAGARSIGAIDNERKESQGTVGIITGRQSGLDTEVRQVSDAGQVLSASMPPNTQCHGADWNAKVMRRLQRLLQKNQLKFVRVWQSWWEGITQAQRHAVESLFNQRQMVQVVKDTDSIVWATLLGILRLDELQECAHLLFWAAPAAQRKDAAGPAHVNSDSTHQQHSHQEQQQLLASAGQPSGGNIQKAPTADGSSGHITPAAPVALSSSDNRTISQGCQCHALQIVPISSSVMSNADTVLEVHGVPGDNEVISARLVRTGLQLRQRDVRKGDVERKVDVELCIHLQACSREKHKDRSSFCLRVLQLAATIRPSSVSQSSSSSSSERAGSSCRYCSGGASICDSVAVLPFVAQVSSSVYAEARQAPRAPGAVPPARFPLGTMHINAGVVEWGSSYSAPMHQFEGRNATTMFVRAVREGLIAPDQFGVFSFGRIAPVPGLSAARVDHRLVTTNAKQGDVEVDYPAPSDPLTAGLTRNLATTLWCTGFESLGCLRSNPAGERQRDMAYTIEMPRTQLPKLAINFALEVEVGLFQFDTCRAAPFSSKVRDFAEVKDARVDIAVMRAGISVDVGRRTSVTPANTCKFHHDL